MSWKSIANVARWPLALCCLLPAYAQSTHWLQVSRLGGARITEREADAILREATVLLRMRDTASDFATLVSLCQQKLDSVIVMPGCDGGDRPTDSRAGGPSLGHRDPIIDDDGPADIFSRKDFEDAMKKRGYIKVVREIKWCGYEIQPGSLGHFLGCAAPNASSLIVVEPDQTRQDNLKEAVVWAHEYCHSKGMPHREAQNALMKAVGDAKNRVVNGNECRAILRPHHASNPNAHSRTRPCSCVSSYPKVR
ncbi:MAG TPA: hypothetical protein VN924_04895 [Bryobacteraceae bacterium]|nr:hypothetical protein [Bryobacteraceae bacterium]